MPSVSAKQARTMRAAMNNLGFRKKMGIPKKVAEDYVHADQRKAGKKKKKER